MKKRIFSWVLALCMVLTLVPATVFAAEEVPAVTKDSAVEAVREEILVHASGEAVKLAAAGDQTYAEAEPNDSVNEANMVQHDFTVMAEIGGDDVDCYYFEVDTRSEIWVSSICTTDSLAYGVLDLATEEIIAECQYLGYDAEQGVHVDALGCAVEPGAYCLIFLDMNEDYLEYMFYLENVAHEYSANVYAPGCNEMGWTYYTCSSCGDSYEDDYVDALGHDYENCTVTGYVSRYQHLYECGRCGVGLEYEDCYSANVETVKVTCTQDGSVSFTCDVCGTFYRDMTPATGHDFEGAKPGFDEETRTHSRLCVNCNKSIAEACSFGAGVIVENATADRIGMMEYTCTVCGGSYQEVTLYRVSGEGRCETAIAAADEMKAILGVEKFDAIILANGDNFADALTGSYLATVKGAPILLYRASAMELNLAYIAENLAEDGVVYLLGGTVAVPADVEVSLADYEVVRLFGETRFETNLKILEEAGLEAGQEILVATGYNFADSLSASATGLPILLVNNGKGELTGEQTEYLETLEGCTFTIVGGTVAVSETLETAIEAYGEVTRLAGDTREATSVLVAETYFEAPECVVLAYSRNFPDGLCGGPLANAVGAPLILTNAGQEKAAAEYVTKNGVANGIVLGGVTALKNETVAAIFADVEIPAEEPEEPEEPTEPEPTEPEPTEPEPTEPEPTEPEPTEPEPTEPAPTEPEPTEPESTEPAPSEPEEEELTEAVAYQRMIALKDEYYEGRPWTNDDFYAWNGGIYSGGYGCAAFAFILSDAAFGDLPARMIEDNITIADIRVGDILRINNDSHSVIVLEVYDDYVVITEGNYNSSIHWGRTLTAAEVAAADNYMTRYPV